MATDHLFILSESLVADVRITKTPFNPNVSGYGAKIPTQYMVKHATSERWHRVYVMAYGKSRSPYIERHGIKYYLTSGTESQLEALHVD